MSSYLKKKSASLERKCFCFMCNYFRIYSHLGVVFPSSVIFFCSIPKCA